MTVCEQCGSKLYGHSLAGANVRQQLIARGFNYLLRRPSTFDWGHFCNLDCGILWYTSCGTIDLRLAVRCLTCFSITPHGRKYCSKECTTNKKTHVLGCASDFNPATFFKEVSNAL